MSSTLIIERFAALPIGTRSSSLPIGPRSLSGGLLKGPQLKLKKKFLRKDEPQKQSSCRFEQSNPTNISNQWEIKELKEAPEGYMIARTSRFIRDIALVMICTRIVTILKKIGLMTEYDSINATAKCQTLNFMKIHVNLYRGKGRFSDGIIVEVKKMSRGGFELMKDIRSILNAVEGKRESEMFKTQSIKDVQLESHDGAACNDLTYLAEALDLSEKYINESCLCAKTTGMRTLISILDVDKTESKYVINVCQTILLGKTNPLILKHIEEFVEGKTDENQFYLYDECRYLSLIVIERAFQAMRRMELESYTTYYLNENPWLMDTLIPMLIEEVMNVERTPGNALSSLKCLNELMNVSLAVIERVSNLNFEGACRGAISFGERHSDALFAEAKRGLEAAKF